MQVLEQEAEDKNPLQLMNIYLYSLLLNPKNIEEVIKDEHWMKAMKEEISQIEKNKTWELVPRPLDKNVIGTKWVFRNKMD